MSIAKSAFIHPDAIVLGLVSLGARSSVWPTAVLRGDTAQIELGEDSNVQDGAVLHGDDGVPCIVGKRVTIGHRAIVHASNVEDDCLIGMGAIVLSGVMVGRGSLIAAGAVVREGTLIPPNSLVVGVPAKVTRPVSEIERERIAHGWQDYVAMASTHRAGRFPRHRQHD